MQACAKLRRAYHPRKSRHRTKPWCDMMRNHPSGRRLARTSHLCYTLHAAALCQTRVKLNRVFFPRWNTQARSLGGWFTSQHLGTAGISLIHSCASIISRRGIWLPSIQHRPCPMAFPPETQSGPHAAFALQVLRNQQARFHEGLARPSRRLSPWRRDPADTLPRSAPVCWRSPSRDSAQD